MEVDRILFPVYTLGPGARIAIWTIGCSHMCQECCNKELWKDNFTKDISIEALKEMILAIKVSGSQPVEGLTITGGEPFEQPEELEQLVSYVNKHITQDILIFTGYTLKELKNFKNPHIERILNKIAVLIDGKYVEEENDNLPLRGSSNQKIHFLSEKFKQKYQAILTGKRMMQNFYNGKQMVSVGIPVKNHMREMKKKLKAKQINYKESVHGSYRENLLPQMASRNRLF